MLRIGMRDCMAFFKAMCNASLMCYTIRFFKELGSEWKNLNQRCVAKMG
jgi:hypothetical protein